ncbi:MAG: DUF4157 domain-containing protein, partial [Cyanobacteria bacterium J06633_2]
MVNQRIRVRKKRKGTQTSPPESLQQSVFSNPSVDQQAKSTASPSTVPLSQSMERSQRFGHRFSQIAIDSPIVRRKRKQDSLLVQTELTLGQPDDAYEKEADQKASEVVAALDGNDGPSEQSKKDAPDQEPSIQTLPQEPSPDRGSAANSAQEKSIEHQRGNGQGLDDGVREPMEHAFGANFANVRVHTNTESDRLNRSFNSQAFTTGNDIFFQQGAYAPGNKEGKELLAHELTHVVQQGGSTVRQAPIQRMPGIKDAVDKLRGANKVKPFTEGSQNSRKAPSNAKSLIKHPAEPANTSTPLPGQVPNKKENSQKESTNNPQALVSVPSIDNQAPNVEEFQLAQLSAKFAAFKSQIDDIDAKLQAHQDSMDDRTTIKKIPDAIAIRRLKSQREKLAKDFLVPVPDLVKDLKRINNIPALGFTFNMFLSKVMREQAKSIAKLRDELHKAAKKNPALNDAALTKLINMQEDESKKEANQADVKVALDIAFKAAGPLSSMGISEMVGASGLDNLAGKAS